MRHFIEKNDTGPEEQTSLVELTNRQLEALPILATADSITEGARIARIGRATVYRWMRDPDFEAAYTNLRRNAADVARADLEGLMLKGVQALAESLDHPNDAIRMRAIALVLSLGLKNIELRDYDKRISRLYRALSVSLKTSGHRRSY